MQLQKNIKLMNLKTKIEIKRLKLQVIFIKSCTIKKQKVEIWVYVFSYKFKKLFCIIPLLRHKIIHIDYFLKYSLIFFTI